LAGQPRKRALALELEQRTRSRFEDTEHTLLDYVVDWVEGGGTIVGLGRELEEQVPELKGLASSAIRKLLCAKYSEDQVNTRLDNARRGRAETLVESALDDALQVKPDRDAIARLRVLNDARYWTAERDNRERFGQPKQQAVVINIGSLHLDAMRQRTIEAPALAQLQGAAEDAVEVTIE
jgi:hypothetical protein